MEALNRAPAIYCFPNPACAASTEKRDNAYPNDNHASAVRRATMHARRHKPEKIDYRSIIRRALHPAIQCHNRRNVAEYEGHLEIDARLLAELIDLTEELLQQVKALGPVKV